MEKVKIDPSGAYIYPMPMVLVGAVVEGKANFMAVAWATRVNFRPPLFAAAIGPHYTSRGIEENGEFSINIPGISLMEKTDYCGLVSGVKKDKSKLFNIFYGELEKAPLIEECPMSISLSLYDTVEMPSNKLYIGEPAEVFIEEKYMTDDKPDITRINPFMLTMPGNRYWAVGEEIGKAWSAGRVIRESEK